MNAPAQALRSQALRRRLLELVAEAAGRATDAIPSDAPLRELGLDSTALVELCAALSTELGRAVPINALWEHPSVDALAEHLCPSRQADDDLPTSSARDEPIAIVGLACRL
ncbi:MAG: acyl carrier protein, partial [Myxococcales bacterium]|nr:acyl carrier protein [Myxococcales bacterium]